MCITLSELRKQRKLSQEGLAKALGCAPSTIAMYELGERNPPLKKAKEIARFFDVAVEEIIFGSVAHSKGASDSA